MNAKISWSIAVVATLLLAGDIVLAVLLAPSTNAGFKDAATALAFISGAAVAIERIIEVFWTFLGGLAGTYWPLNSITKQVDALITELDTALKPFHEDLQQKLEQLVEDGRMVEAQKDEAVREIARLKERFDELKKLAPDNQRVQLLAAAAAQNASYLRAKYSRVAPTLEEAERIANITINGVQDFVSTFKDNPGRRLASIYFGAILGVALSGFFGLDLFSAVLNASPQYPTAQIIITGLIIGLGSNPTHEVIRAIQEYKKSRKGENTSTPNLPTDTQPEPQARGANNILDRAPRP